jgi:thiaminase
MSKEHENVDLQEVVNPEDSPMKEWMVTYVGKRFDQEDVTVEMIVDVMANEFPEFLLAVAEENYIRGYSQGLEDLDTVNG